jgi:tRNA A-37 threonylcarbamoyl transferase component Bud32
MERVRNVMRSDRWKSIQEISAKVGILVGNIHNILHTDLNICQHLVSKKC